MTEEIEFGYALKSKQVRHYEINDLDSVKRALTANAQEYLVYEGVEEKSPVSVSGSIFRVFISSLGIFIFIAGKKILAQRLLSYISFIGFFGLILGMIVNNCIHDSYSVFFVGSGKVGSTPNKKFAALNHHKLRFHLFIYPYSPLVKFIAEITDSGRLFRPYKSLVSVEKNVYYGKYFGSNGYFYPPALTSDVDDIIEELIQKIPNQ
ncbi:unnamed protein product [Phytomonas sp. Hart1]|nr:unnamed protein product [Phytomonas sp. Hart1]|eukprot:CCW71299.1 unnamed protein product [Phytomonas sp. isolate Hart1]